MNSKTRALIGLTVVGFMAACAQPTNPRKNPVGPTFEKDGSTAAVAKTADFAPQADILFVIDNSESMAKHQEKLKTNINRFVSAFEANKQLDFHIGVVSVFDSRRYGKVVKDFYPLGTLYPLKDPAHPGEPVAGDPFVTRAPRYTDILGETLKIGVIPRLVKGPDGKMVDGGGPEFEEIFSPILAALDGHNKGFLRKDAHLAVIVITDADDMTDNVTPDGLSHYLVNLKGGRRDHVSTFGVLALAGCKPDPGLIDKNGVQHEPERIQDFIKAGDGTWFSLCDDNYGSKLQKVGEVIQEKASKPLRLRLTSIPETCSGTAGCEPMRVFFNDPAKTPVVGWTYDTRDYAIVIPWTSLQNAPAKSISYEYTAIDGTLVGTNRVVPLSEILK